MMKKIIIIGAGGHAKSCIDIIESSSKYKISHILGSKNEFNKKILNYKINLVDKDLNRIKKNQLGIIGIGQIKNSKKRKYYYDLLKSIGIKFPVIKSRKSYVSKHAYLGDGTVVFHGAIINAGVKVGQNCIINSQALIEHDVLVDNHVHISTGAKINGGCKIGSGTFVGSGAVIKQNIKIGKNCIIGAGVVLKKNLSNNLIIK